MATSPSKEKACGECTLCCKVMAIEELAKPAGSWCPHCQPRRGCQVYAGRPTECRNFNCLWLVNDRLDQRWKPSRSRIVLTTSEDGIEVRCDPGFPDAWRKEPFRSEVQQWAIAGETLDVTVVVISGARMILVTPEREFDLGIVRPDQRIVRELEGTRIVNVTLASAAEIDGRDDLAGEKDLKPGLNVSPKPAASDRDGQECLPPHGGCAWSALQQNDR